MDGKMEKLKSYIETWINGKSIKGISVSPYDIYTCIDAYKALAKNENFEFTIELVTLTNLSCDELKKLVMNISEVDKVVTELIEINSVKAQVAPKEIVKAETAKPAEKAPAKPAAKPAKSTTAKKQSKGEHKKVHQSVRVDLDRIDKLMNMV